MDSFFHKDKPNTAHAADGATADHYGDHPKPSKSELLSSAKIMADAARSGNMADKGKLAGAAADLLDAAATYGKLDEKQGLGKYMDQAEDYLHKYHTSHSSTETVAPGHAATANTAPDAGGGKHPGGDKDSSGGGYGDMLHMAEGLFKKH